MSTADRPAARGDDDPQIWFTEHFDGAAGQVLDFLGGSGVEIVGKQVVDIGAGDGIIDLGLVIRGRPEKLVGYDLRPTDVDALRRSAQAAGVAEQLPEALSFSVSGPTHIPEPDDTFDVAVTWSVFEHVNRPEQMLREVTRILKPDGVLFLQLWPFFYSEHGGHLWPHYDGGFPHLLHGADEIRSCIQGRRGTDATRGDALEEFESLNRITLDDLQRALLGAGLTVTKLELISRAAHIPLEASHIPLSALGIGGVKLLAVAR